MPPPTDPGSEANLPTLGEHYKLVEKLGEGAFGKVYRATHDLLGQDFAVKLLRPELSEDEDICNRFLDEARALISFSHPNVVQMRHVGRHEGRLFLVMDFVEGVELGELMQKHGAFGEKRALALIKQILAGLEAAHAAGIVHRDMKPSNILVQTLPDGTEKAKILDFGLSKFSAVDGVAGAHRSITGTIIGTLAYMSPEQITGDKDIDGRSDLFATGLILQEMLQGHHPYPGESGIVVAAKLLRDPIPPIEGEQAEKISDSTKSALGRALERDRDARFASVMAFSQSLEGRGPPSDTSRVTTVLEAQQELARQEALAEAAERAAGGGTPKKKGPLLPLLVVAVLALGAAAFFVFGGDKDKPPADPGGATTARGGNGATTHPGKAEPAKAEPAKSDPGKAEPGKADPGKADPGKAEPVKADPAKADPGKAEPAKGDPDKAGGSTPAPTDPDAALPPLDCCGKAGPLLADGRWTDARALYLRAAGASALTDDVQVAALRGAAESWIRQADQAARSGDVEAALAHYDEALAWLQTRHGAYEKIEQAVDAAPLQLGYSRMHAAECHVERARWLGLRGKSDDAADAMRKAAIAFDFALQTLDRRGVHFWEFLVHRAEMHRLAGDTEKMIADVRAATKTKDTSVPPHMWVEHAADERRVAQAYAQRGDAAQALTWARQAEKVATDGVSWQENPQTGVYNLTRRQWLAMVRVIFVLGTTLPVSEDPNAVHGLIRYWLSEAKKKQPSGAEDAAAARGRLLTAEAMERYLAGRVAAFRKQAAPATKTYAEAAAKATEALQLRSDLAAKGGEQVDPLPHEVHAAILSAQGQAAEAQAAREAALAAAARNPD